MPPTSTDSMRIEKGSVSLRTTPALLQRPRHPSARRLNERAYRERCVRLCLTGCQASHIFFNPGSPFNLHEILPGSQLSSSACPTFAKTWTEVFMSVLLPRLKQEHGTCDISTVGTPLMVFLRFPIKSPTSRRLVRRTLISSLSCLPTTLYDTSPNKGIDSVSGHISL